MYYAYRCLKIRFFYIIIYINSFATVRMKPLVLPYTDAFRPSSSAYSDILAKNLIKNQYYI